MKNKLSVLLAIAFILTTGVTASALPVALQSYTEVEITDGSAIISGEVSYGHDIFGFDALAGDLLTLSIDVTAILPGSESEDDDTQLFLFDEWGALLAENDDAADNSFQSLIDDFFVQQDGMYFVGVTTFDNPPLFDADGIISGWNDIGLSHVRYNLGVSMSDAPVPEPATWLLLGVGMTGLAVFRKKRVFA